MTVAIDTNAARNADLYPPIKYKSMRGHKTLIATFMTAAALAVTARRPADFLVNAPERVVPLLSTSDRLDMLDYYRYGSTRGVKNMFQDESRIVEETPATLTLVCDSSAHMQLAVIPAGKDTLVAVATTVALPAHETVIEFYHSDWTPAGKKAPRLAQYSDWFVDGVSDTIPAVAYTLPFVTAVAHFDSTASTLTLRNTVAEYLTPAEYDGLKHLLRDSIVYDISKGKFKQRQL